MKMSWGVETTTKTTRQWNQRHKQRTKAEEQEETKAEEQEETEAEEQEDTLASPNASQPTDEIECMNIK